MMMMMMMMIGGLLFAPLCVIFSPNKITLTHVVVTAIGAIIQPRANVQCVVFYGQRLDRMIRQSTRHQCVTACSRNCITATSQMMQAIGGIMAVVIYRPNRC